MVRKRFQTAKTGIEYLKSLDREQLLKKIGMGEEDRYFWKQVGKALLTTYALIGAVWLYNETSPLGWWTLKPRPKEEREMAHLYERLEYPYPGDEEAMEEFIAKGGMIGTVIGPKGMINMDKDGFNYEKELQNKKLEQEAQKLWMGMRNEVISEIQEKGTSSELIACCPVCISLDNVCCLPKSWDEEANWQTIVMFTDKSYLTVST